MRFWLSSMALLVAAPAIAQEKPAEAPAGETIVVVGNEARDKQVQAFVRSLAFTREDSLPRFELEKLCLAASGLSPRDDLLVTSRMRKVAAAAGLELGEEGCRPNAVAIFAGDKAEMIRELEKDRPDMFPADPTRLKVVPGPAQAWRVTGLVTRDGHSPDQLMITRTTKPGSRLVPPLRPVFDLSVVVIERGALDGLTTVQVADYALMRLLTPSNPARLPAEAPPTILKVLTTPMGQEVPVTMTAWDFSFLRSYYRSPSDRTATAQRGLIADSMRRDLDRTETAIP
jgi:hypothetical protein